MRRNFIHHQGIPIPRPAYARQLLGLFLLYLSALSSVTHAQTPPITTSGLNTQVSGPIAVGTQTQYNITGGLRPLGSNGQPGGNLFHSFGQFNVPTNNIANFLNETALPTSNILARVTGGNLSTIYGTIQTTGFGNANLFLMNPAGFLFGPNATVNVGGMVAFTSADYLRLEGTGGSGTFYADPAKGTVLTSSPVAAFGFLGSNPGAITVQGSQLSITPGQSLSLVGGNITIQSGTLDNGTVQPARLSAPGGQINLASMASPGEVSAADFMPSLGMTMGNITLSQGARLDVSANAAGTVRIRGGQLQIADATISADTGNANGAPTAVDIQVTGDMSISDTRGVPAITARTTGLGDAGEVHITSANLEATSTVRSLFSPTDTHFAIIDTHTSGSGKAGNVTIETTGNLNATGQATGPMYLIDSGMIGPNSGNGGDVALTAKDISLTNTHINSGDFIARTLSQESGGNGGNITITADTLSMNLATIATDGFWIGRAGDLTISVRDIQMTRFSQLSLMEFGGGGALKITADRFIADSAQFELETVDGRGVGTPWTGISITGRIVELGNGTTLRSQTVGDGNAGDIRISATDHLTLADRFTADPNDLTTLGARSRPTGLFTNSLGNADLGTLGNAGAIVVTTPRLEIIGGARINSTTQSNGRGGDVTVTANQITISGERPFEVIEEGLFGLGSTLASGIYTRTVGSEFCTGACGDAGHVSITTGSLNLNSGAVINSGTASTGHGGDVTVHASDSISISGAMVDGTPGGVFSQTVGTDSGSGNGGHIELHAAQFEVTNGAQISASSLGTGNAGNVILEGPASPAQSVLIDGAGSGIFTDTQGTGAGGNIFVNANSVTLSNGGTLSAATSGTDVTATGGTITIAATDVQLTSGALITAQTTGAGNAGAINITANDIVSLQGGSAIASTSFFNISGNGGPVTITAPTVSLQDSGIVTLALGFGSGISTAGAGDVTINASKSVSLVGGTIDSSISDTAGNAGHISITAPTVSLSNASTISSAASNSSFNPDFSPVGLSTDGNGGLVELAVGQLTLASDSQITTQTSGAGLGGSVTVHGMGGMGSTATDVTITSGAGILTNAADLGAAGHITVDTARLTISDGGQMQAATISAGTGGTITIRATEQVIISGEALLCPTCSVGTRTLPSQINTSSDGAGRAGNILIETPTLSLSDGGRIVASTFGGGAGGTVTVQGPQGTGSMANSFLASGQSSEGAVSGIFTDTQGTGSGGSISINASAVTLQNGGALSAVTSGTASTATGGIITVNANQVQLNSGALITASTTGAGTGGSITIGAGSAFASNAGTVSSSAAQATGGDINISAGQSVTLDNGSLITASSTGAGNAGNIVINAGQQYTSTNSSVTTKAEQASGGNITVLATGLVHLTTSEINASVEGSSTTVGGNILIDPVYVILENSQILAQATQGQGGNINIFYTGALLTDSSSVISASSQFGQSGTVTFQSPISPASGKIVPLSQKPLIETSLMSQRCAALAGGNFSSFTLAGRDTLPAEPGGWLSTPLALGTLGENKGLEARSERETPLLSLRQIAPPGFLTQVFAVESSGCQS